MELAIRTGNGMVTAVFGADATVSVAVEAGHGFLGEEGEGFLEDCFRRKRTLLASFDSSKHSGIFELERKDRDDFPACSRFGDTYVGCITSSSFPKKKQ